MRRWRAWVERVRRELAGRLARELGPRWQALQPRERALLLAAGWLLPVAGIVFSVMLPLHDANRSLRAEAVKIEQAAAEAERLASIAVASGAKGGVVEAGQDLLAVVERLARKTGVRTAMSRIRPQPATEGQALLVEFRSVSWASLLRFVDGLAQRGVDLGEMRVQQAASGGRVHARAVIRRGA
ncbi:MAG: type II secretion system protein GspM [Mariprofundaceae bacterium]